jgi:hypothetical protein
VASVLRLRILSMKARASSGVPARAICVRKRLRFISREAVCEALAPARGIG